MTTAVINNMEQDGPAVVKIVGNGSVVECFHERLSVTNYKYVYLETVHSRLRMYKITANKITRVKILRG